MKIKKIQEIVEKNIIALARTNDTQTYCVNGKHFGLKENIYWRDNFMSGKKKAIALISEKVFEEYKLNQVQHR